MKTVSERYPVIAQGYGIFIEPYGGSIFLYEEHNSVKRPLSTLEDVNVQACAILEHCTGSKTVGEVVHILEKEFEDTPPDLFFQVESFLDEVFEKGYILYSDEPVKTQGIIQGSITYYTPVRVLMEVTTACNLTCAHCLLSAERPLKGELSVSQFKSIAQRLFEMGVNRLTLSGGEILTKKGWDVLLDFCIERFYSVFLTNALLMTEEIAQKVKKCKEVHVSLYGNDSEAYERFSQVEGSFEKALRGIKLLTERGANVGASIPMVPFNLADLEDTIDLAISLKCSTARVGTVIPLGRAQMNQWELTEDQREWLDSKVRNLQRKYKSITIQWEEDFEKAHRCGAGCTRWTIASNGDVYPCVLFRAPLGNLTQKDPKDICTSPAVKFLEVLETPHKALCGNCQFLYICEGCHGQAHAHWFKVDHCKWAEQFEKAPEPLKNAVLNDEKIKSKKNKRL